MHRAWGLLSALVGCTQAPVSVECPPTVEVEAQPESIGPSVELLKRCDESDADACEEAYARLYLGVHYPMDVLAGMAMGVLIGSMVALI